MSLALRMAGTMIAGVADPYWSNVSGLFHFEDGNGATIAVNSKSGTNATATGTATVSTAQSKFGTGSGLTSPAGNSFKIVGTDNGYAFGLGDFTVEFFLRLNGTPAIYTPVYDSRPPTTQGNYPTILLDDLNRLTYYTSAAFRIVGSALPLSTWCHIALCRVSGNTRLFIDGVQTGNTYADSASYLNATDRPIFNGDGYGHTDVNGNIDELRVTKAGRYSTNFTPPTAPFQNN